MPVPHDTVFMDHRSGVRQAMCYLTSMGHRRIALLGPGEHIRPGREKLLGYQDGLADAGLDFDPALVYMSRSAIDSSREQTAAMLALGRPPTALIGLGTRLLSGASTSHAKPDWRSRAIFRSLALVRRKRWS